MSDKFNALWIILNKLDQKEKVTARSRMEDLEVSERSIYRYITTLQVAGFPVDYDRGMNSYVFSEGYTLKKPAVSVEETLALALSKKLLHNFGPNMERSLARIEEKLSIKKPEDLYDDPHLRATGGLADVRLPDGDKAGQTVKTTLFPFTMAGERLGVRLDPPRHGEHTRALLSALGLTANEIDELYRQRAVA